MSIRHSLRAWILLYISGQYIYCLVETASTQLILQLAVVKQRILGNRRVKLCIRRHSKRVHCVGLVALTQVAVSQMIRSILCKQVIGTTRLTQIRQRLVVECATVERVTHNIVLHTTHLTTVSLVSTHILLGTGVVIELKPRLRHYSLNLHRLLGGSSRNQSITTLNHIAILALLEINLHNIERHQVAILRTLEQGVKALTSHIVLTSGVGYV